MSEGLTVGATLSHARATAGLSLEQVAASTRIRATVVEAIERDDFRLCGGDVYARGHLKSMASAIGLDPAAIAAQFDAQQGAARPSAAPVEPIDQPTRVMAIGPSDSLGALAGTLGASMSGGRRGGANWTAVMALALVIVFAAGAVSYLSGRSSPSSSLAGPGPSSSPAAAPTTTTAAPSSPPATVSPSSQPSAASSSPSLVAQADGVSVVLAVTGRASWVRVTNAGGRTLYEGTLTTGRTKTFTDKSKVALLVGNAGAVSLKVNGRDLGAPGSDGQVIKVSFGPGDPTTSSG